MKISRRKKIVTECITWRWNGNLGDDLIYAAQEKMFEDLFEFGQYVNNAEAVFIGGGTFITKALHHPDLIDLSKRLPLVIFGTGVGDPFFWGKENISNWIEVIRNAKFIGVRGPLSLERLLEWGAPEERIQWIGDSALFFAKESKQVKPFKKRIAINLGITYDRLYGGSDVQVEEALTLVVEKLIKKGWHVTLVSAWGPDDEVLERIKAKNSVKSIEYWHDDYLFALESVEKFDIVLSEKLHVAIVAACRGVPFIALNYRSKILDFCRSVNWEKFSVNTENVDIDQVFELIEILSKDTEDYSRKLINNVMQTKKKLIEGANIVKNLFAV